MVDPGRQDPLYTIQTHLIYTFRPGFWTAASAGYGYGGKSTVSGVEKNDRRENLAWALSFGFPITRQLGIKVIYLATRTQESIGQDADSIAAPSLSFGDTAEITWGKEILPFFLNESYRLQLERIFSWF